MPEPSPDLDALLIRQASLSVVLHGLMDRMITKDLLTGYDIAAIRRYALDMTTDLQNAAGAEARATGIRIAEEVEAFLRVHAASSTLHPLPRTLRQPLDGCQIARWRER